MKLIPCLQFSTPTQELDPEPQYSDSRIGLRRWTHNPRPTNFD